MKSVRVTTVLDASREIRIPAPAELHAGDIVEVEVLFHGSPGSEVKARRWTELLREVEGIFANTPLELPDDPIPSRNDFPE